MMFLLISNLKPFRYLCIVEISNFSIALRMAGLRLSHSYYIILQLQFYMTHKMHLNETPFRQIQYGEKTIEIRLNDEKRQQLQVGDVIVFALRDSDEVLEKEITALRPLTTFAELFTHYPEVGDVFTMRTYYSEADEQRYGVLAIELK